MKMMLSLRGKDLRPSVYFRNDSHFSYHRRKMLRPVVFTFKKIDHLKKRPYILAVIVHFEGIVSRQKLSKSYHLSKIENFVKLFALISYLKENHMF